jgi:hypothetical protein
MALLSPTAVDSARFAPGTYHTDGSQAAPDAGRRGGDGELREVENCRTLDVMLIPLLELEAMDLTPIATQPRGRDKGE